MVNSSLPRIALLLVTCWSAWLCESKLVRADGPRTAEQTVASFKVLDKLEVQVFASEPMIANPTNITVDDLGRVWVCDVVNYRKNQGKRVAGDRILILEDKDGDGLADISTVFYQGHDVNSAMGICVLGNKVIVSCSPNIFMFTDEDGDGRADKKSLLFTNTGVLQHDHSAHAFVFGPDGCLYWNIGNEHHGVFKPDGKAVVDIFGRTVQKNGNPYRQGMAFRQDLSGKEFEVLAHNIRNSYELTVDAFGRVWFTDNDDDGNRGTRFCYTLNGGNYGYTDEVSGKSWRTNSRMGMSLEIPERHWHQNDPGSIPNVLNNGSGSPAGVEVYEADLLPNRIRGGVVHCDPGHNVVRVYLPVKQDSGYTAETIELIDGRNDPWFRPVDSSTAPDGSLLIADWYDPGLGGHRQADIDRGRIYRIAPRGSKYHCSKVDYENPDSACLALCSGNSSARFSAWSALAAKGVGAEKALLKLSHNADARARARAYWLLTLLPESGASHLKQAAKDPDERVRAAATRMTTNLDIVTAQSLLDELVDDPSTLVQRAAAIALRRYYQHSFSCELWARLAEQFDGTDRWYLEALGLSAEMQWDRCLDKWLNRVGSEAWRTPAGRKLIWRSRGTRTLEMLTALLADPATPSEELPMLLRAIDFNEAKNRNTLLLDLIENSRDLPPQRWELIASEALKRLSPETLGPRFHQVLSQVLENITHDDTRNFLVMQYQVESRYIDLYTQSLGKFADTGKGVELLRFLVQQSFTEPLESQLSSGGISGTQLARMLALTMEPKALKLLEPLVNDSNVDPDLRREAIRSIATSKSGAEQLVKLAEKDQLDQSMRRTLHFALKTSPWTELSQRVVLLQSEGDQTESEQLPIAEWMRLPGAPDRGKQLFLGKANCASCHKFGNEGNEIGPSLAEIGNKLSRTGMYESILFPSAAISHNYESYIAVTDGGLAITGILISESEETITLKTDKALVRELRRDELEEFEKLDVSLMPSGLHRLISPLELADLVAYLSTLKAKPAED
ncbi:PVC-type heme-binding CxxCH protein [Adhaeretor mobilis]|nr:PVC-type heme-binding CxxCH protein [Adhaeretor mobilis]